MDEETVEKLREQLIQELLALDVNAASGSDDEELTYKYDNDTEQGWFQPRQKGDDDDGEGDYYDQEEDEYDDYSYDDSVEEEWYQSFDGLHIGEAAQDVDAPQDAPDIDSDDYPEASESATETSTDDQPAAEEKKRKKKKKKKGKKKKNFPQADDDQADSEVMDLAVAEQLYDPDSNVESRFRLAMDMFREERIFTPISNSILETYFSYGNMNEHPEVQGVTRRPTNVDIELEVDIFFIVASFLSSRLFTQLLYHDPVYFETAPRVVAAFLKYLRARHVIPEYEDDLRRAIEVSEMAKIEIPRCVKFNHMMPDAVNQTCSALFIERPETLELPENSGMILEEVIGAHPPKDVRVQDERLTYAKVLRVEHIAVGATASSDSEAALSPDSVTASGNDTHATMRHMTRRVDLEEMTMDCGNLVPVYGKDFSVQLTWSAAALLEQGTVMWGKFYTLSNGVIFAKPLNAFPSYYVEQEVDDDYENGDE
ncbi:hypothetical protein BGZ98_009112 [Dissophora globulifera]|nr:hypothetical protein BGZ98_009112 [Dissophora globulifera]